MARIRATKSTIDYTADNPALIKKEPLQQQKREYTALRDIIQKRLKRIEANARRGDYDKPDVADPREFPFYSYWFTNYGGEVPKLSTISKKDLPYILTMMKKQIGSYNPQTNGYGWETATLKGVNGYAASRVAGLQAAGFTGINVNNLAAFGRFMEQFRAQKLDHVTGSPDAVEIYIATRGKGLTASYIMKNFAYFQQNQNNLQNMSGRDIRDDIQQLKATLGDDKRWHKA